jgi:hypothetical protein
MRPAQRTRVSFELDDWLNDTTLDPSGSSAVTFDENENSTLSQDYPEFFPPYEAQNVPFEPTPPETNYGLPRSQCLLQLLKNASQALSGVVLDHRLNGNWNSITYKHLLDCALRRAKHFPLVMALEQSTTKMVLLYMDNNRDYLLVSILPSDDIL